MTNTDDTKQIPVHTPGPWHDEMDAFVSHIVAPDPTGEYPDGIYIAEIANGDDVVGRFATYEQHEANARLIAAAPELLDALTHTLDFLHANDDGEDDVRWRIEKAQAAIAKATGRAA